MTSAERATPRSARSSCRATPVRSRTSTPTADPRLRWLKQREDSPDETGWLPVALFNASLNTTWTITQAGRRAKSYPFTFSQFHCGSPETGYCRSEAYASTSGGISLATAMATSGAALSSRSVLSSTAACWHS